MSRKRYLTQCSCTHILLLSVGFRDTEISGHHRSCATRFTSLKEWKASLTEEARRLKPLRGERRYE